MLDDQKATMANADKKSSESKVGLAFLGDKYLLAYDFYQKMADQYWKIATSNPDYKTLIGVAKLCYVYAAENAYAIQKAYPADFQTTL